MAKVTTLLRGGPRADKEDEVTSPLIADEILVPYKVPNTQMMRIARYVRADRIVGQRGKITYLYDYRGDKGD